MEIFLNHVDLDNEWEQKNTQNKTQGDGRVVNNNFLNNEVNALVSQSYLIIPLCRIVEI